MDKELVDKYDHIQETLLSSITLSLLCIIGDYNKEINCFGGIPLKKENMEIIQEYVKNNMNNNLYQGLDQLKDILNEEDYQNLLNLNFIKELEKIKTKKSVN